MMKELLKVLNTYFRGDGYQRPIEQAVDLLEAQANEIAALQLGAESQANEIAELKVNNNALKDVIAYEKSRSADYKALCDQMGAALEELVRNPGGDYTDDIVIDALAAWRAMK